MVAATRGILQDADPRQWREHRFGLPASRWTALAGRSFWITGAGTGYGGSLAVALAAAGGRVFLTGRRREKLDQTIEEMRSFGIDPAACLPVPADITDEEQLGAAARVIEAKSTSLYGVVSNAALPQSGAGPSPLADMPRERWDRMISTNLTGQWLTARAALPLLLKGPSARLLFMSSEAGWAFTPRFGPYNVSKAALNNLGASFAAECAERFHGKDIQVNVLVPGEARTEMNQGSSISPYAVVSMALALLSHPPGGPNGRFFHRDGRHLEFGFAAAYDRPLLSAEASNARPEKPGAGRFGSGRLKKLFRGRRHK